MGRRALGALAGAGTVEAGNGAVDLADIEWEKRD
jgi:hypothetical protein